MVPLFILASLFRPQCWPTSSSFAARPSHMGIIRPGLSLTLYKAATLHSPLQLFSSSVPSSPLIPVCLFIAAHSWSSRKSLPKPDKSNVADYLNPQQPSAKKLWPQVVHFIPPSSASLLSPQILPRGFERAVGSGGCRLQDWTVPQYRLRHSHASFCRGCC